MFSTRRIAILYALGFVLVTPTVFAKGPPNPRIIFTNETTAIQVGVSTDGTNSNILAAVTAHSTSAFTTAGGEVLNPGASFTFQVLAGTYTLLAADFSTLNSTGVALSPITESQTVSPGQTLHVYIKDTGNPTATIQFSSTP